MKKIAILSILILSFFAVNIAFAAEQPEMSVYVADINAGETAHVQITLPSDVTGNVIVSVNGQNHTAKVVDGKATVDLKNLKAGNYTVKVTCPENGNYSKTIKNVSLKVNEKSPATADNKTPATADNKTPATADNKTPANASGEPVNTQNVTPVTPTNITNDTNTTNTTNHTTPAKKVNNTTAPVKKPKKEIPKPHHVLKDKNTGIPIAILVLIVIGVVFGAIYSRKK